IEINKTQLQSGRCLGMISEKSQKEGQLQLIVRILFEPELDNVIRFAIFDERKVPASPRFIGEQSP
ncbi:hypothetical protein ACSTI6_23750, partial [Vibrio parahaemolyticus]